jgi:hypothetical protein
MKYCGVSSTDLRVPATDLLFVDPCP